ncbi:hypothetical protein JCM12294_25260 [Desulfocicer niacini]
MANQFFTHASPWIQMKQSDESIQVPAENNPVYVPHLSQMVGVVIKPNFSKKEKICYAMMPGHCLRTEKFIES